MEQSVIERLAEDLPDDAVQAFVAAAGSSASKGATRIRSDKVLRKALASAIARVPMATLVGVSPAALASEDVLGVELDDPMPEGWTPEGVLVLVRGLDPAGNRSIMWLPGGDVVPWEMVGMLDCAREGILRQIAG